MDELKREVQHRGAEVELTRQELQATVDIKVHSLLLSHWFQIVLKFNQPLVMLSFVVSVPWRDG